MNSDPTEIAKFSQAAAQWWDPEGPFSTLHVINPVRLGYLQQQTQIAGKRILDVGCGGGILSESMADLGATVTGIDLSSEALQVAKLHQHGKKNIVDYQLTSVEALANTQPNTFEIVTCLEMLEHVPDPQSVIQSCAKLAQPGADLFFSTLNRNVKAYFGAIIAAEYLLKLLPRNTHDFKKFIRPSELDQWIRQAGLTPVNIIGLHYNPFTKSATLNQDVSINYIVHVKKP
ncbi:MAG: bifunctional 2-polyprenyl-6-hydroxyphenol methylase/3-demethylubiquinol 3-O-methyltransferase UbiG [Gammaproteobacteria bacterium]|nr:bifunctional 2-polyprenyl-6-hydroxyphenol methylase/3-demethylubiquinol 3-O-methyltransferase UbiG [Gammaproteobacteria bacterium]